MRRGLRDERGSALILAVIAMLVMGVLSVSFALLADIETKIGVNYKQQGQAEALAEAALERARDVVRTAPTATGGFTSWINGTAAGMSGAHLFSWNGSTLGPGQYSARIDNDCNMANTVPLAIQEPAIGGIPCDNTTDTNETAVVTAWARSGPGASRIRAIVAVDNPWKHVCSNAKADNNGYCNEPGNRNGTPTIQPADPNDPNGPAGYTSLPLPVLGCSRIAPLLHTAVLAECTVSYPNMYPAPYPSGAGVPRFVLMGEPPGPVGVPPKSCNDEPAGGNGNRYFGYFDCALTTFCDTGLGHVCGAGGSRKGCLHPTDSRTIPASPNYDPTHYVAAAGSTCLTDTGMVYIGNTTFNQDVGSQTKQFDVYVLNGIWTQGNNRVFYGTLAVEGNEVNTPCADKDFQVGGGASSQIWSGANAPGPPAGWAVPHTYGYPLVALIYNPDLAPPTASSPYAPQGTCADLGSSNTEVHGLVYSGGHVEFNPLSLDGGVVAYEIQTQGSATYTYNSYYGNSTPPPGFLAGTGNQVVIIRKSFIVCVNYAADTAATPSLCN